MSEPEFVLGKPSSTVFHHAIEAMMDAALINGQHLVRSGLIHPDDLKLMLKGIDVMRRQATAPDRCIILVEHDWLQAIPETDGEVRLPSANSIFEFRINGKSAVWWKFDDMLSVSIQDKTDWVSSSYYVGIPSGDMIPVAPFVDMLNNAGGNRFDLTPAAEFLREINGPEQIKRQTKLAEFLTTQVRAMCIALDAEVIVKDMVRAPHRLNVQREKRGRLPISSYHVVRLARRERAAPIDRDDAAHTGRRLRMHFVRGHWRHYEQSKTWVRWHLRGDPDLGRIEKEYRL